MTWDIKIKRPASTEPDKWLCPPPPGLPLIRFCTGGPSLFYFTTFTRSNIHFTRSNMHFARNIAHTNHIYTYFGLSLHLPTPRLCLMVPPYGAGVLYSYALSYAPSYAPYAAYISSSSNFRHIKKNHEN